MKADVVVVGAGPSGAWAAYCLARSGARVSIVDGSHPREKPCGGGVTGRALALAGEAIAPARVASTRIESARFVDSTRGFEATVAVGSGSLAVASRAAFDAALLDAAIRAGATLHADRATCVQVSAYGVRVGTRRGGVTADFVIGADGANSLVRRTVAAPFRRDQLSIATGFFARPPASERLPDEVDSARRAREIVVEFTADPPGYIWSFPRPDHLAIGICAQADAGTGAGELRERTARWIRETRLAEGAVLQPYSWPIPSLNGRDCTALIAAGPRWCLVGDAAGLVDPITREGIFYALASGAWAAQAIVQEASLDAIARHYAARVHDDAGAELARAARLKAGFFRPAFVALLMRALGESPAIRSVMADLIAGEQSYRTLKWRLFTTFELGLAWRAITARRSRHALERALRAG